MGGAGQQVVERMRGAGVAADLPLCMALFKLLSAAGALRLLGIAVSCVRLVCCEG